MRTLVGAVADHAVGLAGARLAVGEEAAVVALPRVLQYPQAQVVEHFHLNVVDGVWQKQKQEQEDEQETWSAYFEPVLVRYPLSPSLKPSWDQ